MIATSRERLAISLEQEYPVPPLDDAGAEELFISRARQLEPDFEPDETVGEICLRLDRLPLALELASTRVKLMSTSQMLDRINRRLDLLSKGRRDAPDRQATMRATIGWSYDLLPASEQALFRGLGVFAGGFELEAAEGVCGADLDDLQSLIDKSLLRSDERGRFRLLELTREYALEQLDGTGEEAGLRRREADWFLQLAEHAKEHLTSAEQGRWLSRLDADTDNLRAVLAWCSEHDPAGAIELASTLYYPWREHGQLRELSLWLERALATSATLNAPTRAAGLKTLGAALNFVDQYDRAREPLEQSLVLFKELGDAAGEASVPILLGMQFANQGSLARGIELNEAALVVARGAGDTPHIARALNFLGGCFLLTGELERSRATLEEAFEIHTKLGDHHSMAADLDSLAVAALSEGDAELAARHYNAILDVTSAYHSERDELYTVAGMACVAALRGDVHSAGRLWGVVEAAENRLGIHMIAAERALLERIVTPLQGDQAFQAGYATGRDIELAEAVRELRELSESD